MISFTMRKKYDFGYDCHNCMCYFKLFAFQNYMSSGYLFVCFIVLRLKSTAMVMAARSLHLITLFPGQA